jgi:hypothetical protein
MQMRNHAARPFESLGPIETTLLELVHRFAEEDRSEREIVDVVLALLDNEDVTLIGNFRGVRFES